MRQYAVPDEVFIGVGVAAVVTVVAVLLVASAFSVGRALSLPSLDFALRWGLSTGAIVGLFFAVARRRRA